jgi:hypothetical protein
MTHAAGPCRMPRWMRKPWNRIQCQGDVEEERPACQLHVRFELLVER